MPAGCSFSRRMARGLRREASMATITLKNLAHSYKASPSKPSDYALQAIDHSFKNGSAVALLGPSGCGKTTLLNIISGLVIPSQGAVLFDERDVTYLRTEERNIAQVFQFPVVYDTMSVKENLAFPLRNRGVDPSVIEARVKEISALLGMTGDLHRRARRLTADVKQKISLGRGLVRPDVAAILFDEPLTVIDPHLKWELRSKLKELHKKLDRTMIYVTHDQTEALTFADTVVVMYDGGVVQMGTPSELFAKPAHVFVGHFIGSPGMNVLPCIIEGDKAVIDGHAFAMRIETRPEPGAKTEFGIRPEFITLARSGGVPVTIRRIDDLGRTRIARVELAGKPMAAIAPEGFSPDGASASILIDPAQTHLYANGVRIGGGV
jgi:glycerol transport system ATP-binding protein